MDAVLLGHFGVGVLGTEGWFRLAPGEDGPSGTDHAARGSRRPPQTNPRY